MAAHTHYLWFHTKQRQEIIDVTDQVAEQVAASRIQEGFVLVSAMHITAEGCWETPGEKPYLTL